MYQIVSTKVSAKIFKKENYQLKTQNMLFIQALPRKESTSAFNNLVDVGAPSVDFLNSTVPAEPIKSTIGVRKIQPKKGVSF